MTLSVDPGAKIYFHDKAQMTVRGRLEALGAVGKMIEMRGDRLDEVLPGVGYEIFAGQWGGIKIAPESFGNRMEYVDMRSSTFGLVVDSTANTDRSKLLLVNSWLHNSRGSVLSSKYARVDAEGCCFSEAAGHVVELTGGVHNFTQCTFANEYVFASDYLSILGLYHCLPDEVESDLPLMQAEFRNGIIYGSRQGINIGDLTGSQVFLRYMLLGAKGSDDDNFISCLWESDPLFYTYIEASENIFDYNYRVQPDSPAIGAGNPAYITGALLFDMDGVSRLSAGAPTLGAYQYVAPPAESRRRR